MGYWEKVADRKGFEPSKRYKTFTPLAGERLRPLGHLSKDVYKAVNLGFQTVFKVLPNEIS